MATLSLPTNTPATDGAVIGCTTDDTTGTAYAMARTDRQWYFEVSANPLVTQAMIDADKATILAQDITASELVWAGTDADLTTIAATVDGLDENSGPYYVGWVQEPAAGNPWGTDLAMRYSIPSDSYTLTIPLGVTGTFNYSVDWGDGDSSTTNSHLYATAGDYDVRISGQLGSLNHFSNTPPAAALLKEVYQLGEVEWASLQWAFRNCVNLTSVVAGTTDLTAVTSSLAMVAGCTSLSVFDMRGVSTPLLVNMGSMINGTTALVDCYLADVDTGAATSMSFFGQNSGVSQLDIEAWDIESVADFTNFLVSATLDTANYDAILAGWAPQTPDPSVSIHFGNSKYTNATDRATLLGKVTAIWDGGAV